MAESVPPSPARPFTELVAWFAEYFRQNPFKALSTSALAFGCFLLVPVFWGIGELPQLDVSSTLPLLATIAGGGFLITVFLAAMPVAGGWLARSEPGAPAWRSDWWSVGIYVMPGACVSLVLWAAINWVPFWKDSSGFVILLLMTLGPGVLAAVRVWTLRGSIKDLKAMASEWATIAWSAVVLSALMAYLVITSVTIMVPESRTVEDLSLTILLWTVYACAVTVCAVRIRATEMVRLLVASALFVAVVLLAATGGMTSISKAMLKKTGWGNYPAKLFVTDRGCDILNRSTGRELCKPEKGAGGHLVCPVMVRSRIGTPNFFSFSPFTSSGKWPDLEKAVNASLPKEDVIVLQRIAALATSEPPKGVHAGQNLVTHFASQDGAQGLWLAEQCGQVPPGDSVSAAP